MATADSGFTPASSIRSRTPASGAGSAVSAAALPYITTRLEADTQVATLYASAIPSPMGNVIPSNAAPFVLNVIFTPTDGPVTLNVRTAVQACPSATLHITSTPAAPETSLTVSIPKTADYITINPGTPPTVQFRNSVMIMPDLATMAEDVVSFACDSDPSKLEPHVSTATETEPILLCLDGRRSLGCFVLRTTDSSPPTMELIAGCVTYGVPTIGGVQEGSSAWLWKFDLSGLLLTPLAFVFVGIRFKGARMPLISRAILTGSQVSFQAVAWPPWIPQLRAFLGKSAKTIVGEDTYHAILSRHEIPRAMPIGCTPWVTTFIPETSNGTDVWFRLTCTAETYGHANAIMLHVQQCLETPMPVTIRCYGVAGDNLAVAVDENPFAIASTPTDQAYVYPVFTPPGTCSVCFIFPAQPNAARLLFWYHGDAKAARA